MNAGNIFNRAKASVKDEMYLEHQFPLVIAIYKAQNGNALTLKVVLEYEAVMMARTRLLVPIC